MGIGVGFAGTPASHSLTGSVPVQRAGIASGTADLQRDLGGAIMQSILGALLTAGYTAAVGSAIANAPNGQQITDSVQNELTKSFSSAMDTTQQYPQYANSIIAGAKSSFVQGQHWAYFAGIIAILVGAAIVSICFPRKEQEEQLLAQYHQIDTAAHAAKLTSAATTLYPTGKLPRSATIISGLVRGLPGGVGYTAGKKALRACLRTGSW